MKKIDCREEQFKATEELEKGIYLVFFPVYLKYEIWSVDKDLSFCLFVSFKSNDPILDSIIENLENNNPKVKEPEQTVEQPKGNYVREEFVLELLKVIH